jgi:hypothetical protein
MISNGWQVIAPVWWTARYKPRTGKAGLTSAPTPAGTNGSHHNHLFLFAAPRWVRHDCLPIQNPPGLIPIPGSSVLQRRIFILQHNVPLAGLRQADSVRLYMSNQKNGQQGSTMYHTATHGNFCPVKALANRVRTLQTITHPGASQPISYVHDGNSIMATYVNRAYWTQATTALLA